MVFRVRAAAIILNESKELLMVHHRHPKTGEEWWTLPGGGLEGEESAKNAVIREVKEECGVDCVPIKLVYVREFIDTKDKVHHVELFFTADVDGYRIETGEDPELSEQFIVNVSFLSQKQIASAEVQIYPEVLRDLFWGDLKKGFSGHDIYLGQKVWRDSV